MVSRPIDLGTQSNAGEYPHEGVARLVNLFPRDAGEEGQVRFPLRAVSGLGSFAILGSGAVSRMLSTGTAAYVMSGRTLYVVDSEGTATLLGGVPVDGLITMARNNRPSGDQVAVCGDGLLGIVEAGVLTMVSDPDVGVPNSVWELGGYFMTTAADGTVRASELLDGTDWDGLSVEQAGRDLLVGKPRGRDAVLFGRRATHIWTLSPGDTIPIAPRSTIGFGAWSAAGVVEASDALYWPSTNADGAYAGIRALSGDQSQVISTPYVDRSVARETFPSGIAGSTWSEDGRTFLSWSGSDWTHVLDLSTGRWHERSSLIDGALSRWRVGQLVQLGTRVIAADYASGTLWRLDQSYHDEAGTELVTLLQPPPLSGWPGRLEINALHLDVQPGVGLATGGAQDVAPHVAMRWSRDGETWSTELARALGRQGDRGRRALWTRLGTHRAHGLTLQFRASAKVARSFLRAAWDGGAVGP